MVLLQCLKGDEGPTSRWASKRTWQVLCTNSVWEGTRRAQRLKGGKFLNLDFLAWASVGSDVLCALALAAECFSPGSGDD